MSGSTTTQHLLEENTEFHAFWAFLLLGRVIVAGKECETVRNLSLTITLESQLAIGVPGSS